jgi:hypothetical protein
LKQHLYRLAFEADFPALLAEFSGAQIEFEHSEADDAFRFR